ncbi:MAG UNVERIFIED_CONTAM: histidine--tRNA ligase [Rickettsiaceae bacterium]|jgi:histidyl-tRNA synthetase
MSEKLQPIRGMKDLLPDEYNHHAEIIEIAQNLGSLYGYQQISTPIAEYNSVFARTLGDTSEVVSKEMYSFQDRSNDLITLRPEFTASIMRAFVSNGLHHQLPLRFFSTGPLFRYDRPQAGRQRQFHQLNFEYLGADGAFSDAETLKLATALLESLGIYQHTTLELNSIGCKDSRANYGKALKEYFLNYESELSEESKVRLQKNPLRILDSKNESDKKLVANAPIIPDYYTPEAKKYFDDLLSYLDKFGVKYTINPKLVRGLDYYCHTAFEFTTEKLGAQATILGGGRYDGLSKLMGGPDIPAIGFAAGIERIALLREFMPDNKRPIVIIPIGDENIPHIIDLTNMLRNTGKYVLVEHKGKIVKRMQNANKAMAKYTILVGSDEIASNKYKLRCMDDGTETMLTKEELLNYE